MFRPGRLAYTLLLVAVAAYCYGFGGFLLVVLAANADEFN